MDHASAHELRNLRAAVQRITHDLSNVLGIAINYTMFLGEDLARAGAPAVPELPPVQAALARAVELVRELQACVPPVDLAKQQIEADRAEHGER
jgi:hypothetical protein